MIFEPGRVVVANSVDPHMTVAELSGEDMHCLWLSADGGLFRQTRPQTVLEIVSSTGPEDAEEDENEEADDDEDEDGEGEDEDEDEAAQDTRRRAA